MSPQSQAEILPPPRPSPALGRALPSCVRMLLGESAGRGLNVDPDTAHGQSPRGLALKEAHVSLRRRADLRGGEQGDGGALMHAPCWFR